jgi:hypothetical protein
VKGEVKPWWLIAASLLTACGVDGTTWLGEQVGDGAEGSAADAGSGGLDGNLPDPGALASFFVRYEAESSTNAITFPVEQLDSAGYATCPTDGVNEGANCASGGMVVSQILGRSPCQPPTSRTSYDSCQNIGGGVEFNDVTVPVDGTYDITWWYHCGADPARPGRANVYGDTACGGLDYGTGPNTGCRPHLIDVNGAAVSSTVAGQAAPYYHFPCYGTDWSILHGATTALRLKAGSNTIYIHAPGATTLDAADIDALDVHAAGHGTAAPPLWPRIVTPVASGN